MPQLMPAVGCTHRWHNAINEIGESAWQTLLGEQDCPFVSYAFLDALECSGTLRVDYGWRAFHLGIYDETGELIAACPSYLKNNSHGEFVFDWAWAQAYAQHGLHYYPKLICAIPYSPVTGPRLLARDENARSALVQALTQSCAALGSSSVHANFISVGDAQLLESAGWLARTDTQFHWRNDARWRDFQDFLDAFSAKKRKNILQERSKVARLGLRIESRTGAQIDYSLWQQIHGLYESTFDVKGNTAALTLQFFLDYCARQPQQIVAFLAFDGAVLIAMALCFRSANTLYGRYWGARAELPGLHFECCYYQGIEYCLKNGLNAFEPGAQGEHKLARGFLPTEVRSAHFIADPQFRSAIARSLAIERLRQHAYRQELMAHSPFSERLAGC